MHRTVCMIIALLLIIDSALALTLHHQYWFEKDSPINGTTDKNWNYCDEKCLYLENYSKGKDFVVIKFSERFKYPFAACYVKSDKSYLLWNKVIQNQFFEKYCGSDYKDWYNEGFKVEGIYGVGVGMPLSKKI